jgi:hypothetical protein
MNNSRYATGVFLAGILSIGVTQNWNRAVAHDHEPTASPQTGGVSPSAQGMGV